MNKKLYYKIYRENHKEAIKESNRKYQDSHKKQLIQKAKKYRETHKEQIKKINQKYSTTHRIQECEKVKRYYRKHKEKILKKVKEYYRKHRNQRMKYDNLYRKNRKRKDINFKILCNLRIRICDAIRNHIKSKSTKKLIGCSVEQLKQHLESQFKPGMSWSNYGKWHIDHIRPCVSFDLSKPEEQRKCFHYTNLQPLWAKDNLSKGSKNVP